MTHPGVGLFRYEPATSPGRVRGGGLADPAPSPERIAAAHRIFRRRPSKASAAQAHAGSGWIRAQRLDRRRRDDLADPEPDHLPVGAIGGRWGLPDPVHSSHAVKAAYGMPRAARAAGRRRRQP
ncbi:hypothetical protein [Streptomyces sp. AK04-3B]|uniref:hypothetical protein n=1 Tax=Streptomyces sp. AK04-3B TaxID=3028650 RepID=UPI0029B31757|nr:hypothetical protein [Streptomyces sp. AK04-3B]MDX3799786.1 hypothetical protein [Streptomyces sp. AK04-3B]